MSNNRNNIQTKKKIEQTGQVSNRKGQGRKHSVVTEENMEIIRNELEKNNIISQRQLSHKVNIKRR